MQLIKILLGLSIISMTWMACCDIDDDTCSICNTPVVIDANAYAEAPSDSLIILHAEIIEDCLQIEFSSSGCDGETWIITLVDSEHVLYSIPPQRNIRLSLENFEACRAVITKDISFDISELQTGEGKTVLNITNSDLHLLYEF